MKNKKYSIIIVFIMIALSSCKTLNTDLSIKNREIPSRFQNNTDSTNLTQINWRQYYSDTLLVKLIDTALVNNFDLQIALQRIEIARANLTVSNGALLPQVGLDVSGSVHKYGLYTMDGAGNTSTEITPGKLIPKNLPDLYLGLQSSWEIDIWGKLKNQKKSAISQYLSNIEGTNFVITSLISDVASSYYELLALDNELEIIRQTMKKQTEALDVIVLQKDAGRANELAVTQFKGQLLSSQILEKNTEQQIAEAENKINFLLGRFPQPIARVKENLYNDVPKQISSGFPSQLLENRPDIREAEFQVESSKFDLKAAKAAFFPSFNISAGIGFQAFNPKFLFMTPASVAYSALGEIVAPLINMNALKGQFNTAKANQIQAMYNYQKTILNAYVEVENELSNIENLKQISSLNKTQNDLLTKSVETSIDLYKSAKANYLEVLLAQQNALQSNLDLINIYKQQHISAINIYRALGGGWK
jgi:NodT family efflux transporter outer membrane factor (OMF) lipoprotein